MDNQILKSALFGYSKTSVCEYIAQVNAEFSEKLTAAAEESRKERDQLNAKIYALEIELAEYKKNHSDISAALLKAQQHAAEVRNQAEIESRTILEENRKKCSEQLRRIENYKLAMEDFRRQLSLFASDTDEKLDVYFDKLAEFENKYRTEEGKVL